MDHARVPNRADEVVRERELAPAARQLVLAGNAATARWVAARRATLARTQVEGVGDTQNDSDMENIKKYIGWLAQLDVRRLVQLQNRIRNDKHANWEQYQDYIHAVLGARHLLLSAQHSGNISQATVTLCGRIVGVFEDYEAGHKEVPLTAPQLEYAFPPQYASSSIPARYAPTELGTRLSQRDSEVRMLAAIDQALRERIPQLTQQQAAEEPRIELRITSTHGACNECKARLELLVQNVFRDWVTKFGDNPGLSLGFFYRYPEREQFKTRKGCATTYGWRDRQIVRDGDAPIYEVSQHQQEYIL